MWRSVDARTLPVLAIIFCSKNALEQAPRLDTVTARVTAFTKNDGPKRNTSPPSSSEQVKDVNRRASIRKMPRLTRSSSSRRLRKC